MLCPYTRLWECVLIRLLLDSLGYASPTMSDSIFRIENSAKIWLQSSSFDHVCELANKEPKYILKIHAKAKKNPKIEQDQIAKYLRFLLISKE
jgi:hypothetical protein|tara:strand:- start:633 stop:911 length:279 start_codon:yes stop_codon:yes gene_type:complete